MKFVQVKTWIEKNEKKKTGQAKKEPENQNDIIIENLKLICVLTR